MYSDTPINGDLHLWLGKAFVSLTVVMGDCFDKRTQCSQLSERGFPQHGQFVLDSDEITNPAQARVSIPKEIKDKIM